MFATGSPPLEISRVSRAVALAVTIFLSSLLCACSRESPEEFPAAPPESVQSAADSLLDAQPEESLPADPELEEFLWRAQFLLRRISARRPTREEIQCALRIGTTGFADLAGMSSAELSARMDTLRWQGSVLLGRYPALAASLDEIERREGPPCDASDALELVGELPGIVLRRTWLMNNGVGDVKDGLNKASAARCVQRKLRREDLPYLASLILSAATGNPILFFVGSALATKARGGS